MERPGATEELPSSFSRPTAVYFNEDTAEIHYFRSGNYAKPTGSFAIDFLSALPFSSFYGADITPADRQSLTHEELRLPMFDYAEEPLQYNRILGCGDEGIVVAATMKGEEYAVKFVSTTVSSLMSEHQTNVIYCSSELTSRVELNVPRLLMSVVSSHESTMRTLMVSTLANATAG